MCVDVCQHVHVFRTMIVQVIGISNGCTPGDHDWLGQVLPLVVHVTAT